jgi:hypothetical protein
MQTQGKLFKQDMNNVNVCAFTNNSAVSPVNKTNKTIISNPA